MASRKTAALEAMAYHEAAHAVVAHALGVKLKSATIVPPAVQGGELPHRSPLRGLKLEIDGTERTRLDAQHAIAVCLAGFIAHRRQRPQTWREFQGRSDVEEAFDLALRAYGSGELASSMIAAVLHQTIGLVQRRWGDIEVVAAALLDRRKLTGREIDQLLDPAGAPPPASGAAPSPAGARKPKKPKGRRRR